LALNYEKDCAGAVSYLLYAILYTLYSLQAWVSVITLEFFLTANICNFMENFLTGSLKLKKKKKKEKQK